jgi:hypothetical protein
MSVAWNRIVGPDGERMRHDGTGADAHAMHGSPCPPSSFATTARGGRLPLA